MEFVLIMNTFMTLSHMKKKMMMIVVDTRGEVNPKETTAPLTTTAGALDMRGFD